ncbi:hypothetical protein [Frankia sp. AgKG'84/4]|uniref:hypothetical protein n=1 Tax=Frankia sp. AgKG'84/4 TaxID=573490 RepID=UPI00200EC49F|nr:hypothetical protein [Frankia sp. AgKG'84/4]MCL9796983.1 hypothetical protein [Frankia sp. AgKG'84/4]
MPGYTDTVASRLIMIIATASAVSVISGVLIGRYAIPNNSTSPDPTSVASSQSPGEPADKPTPSASATALVPTSVPPPTTTSGGPATAEGAVPGTPTRINQYGIPIGYPRTQAGAVSACANYDAINGKLQNREPTTIRRLYASVATPEASKRLSDLIIENDKKSAKTYGVPSIQAPNFGFIGRATGYSVQSYSDDKADVTIWGVLGFGIYNSADANLSPKEGWATDTCRVIWSDGDWKLEDAGDGPANPAITERAAEGFKEFLLVGAGT